MTTLLVRELKTELTQDIRYKLNKRVQLAAILPYLTMFNAPAGTFTLSLSKGPDTIFSKDFTCDDIKASLENTSDDNAHVFYPVIPESLVQIEKGLYTIKLSATDYTFDMASYIAWNQQFENIQNEMDYEPVDDTENSYAYRIKIHKEGIE